MLNTFNTPQVYTPAQVAKMLQLSESAVFGLIDQGEIIAKKLGKVYRIPAASLSFWFTGMDKDIYQKQVEDEKNVSQINDALRGARKKLWDNSTSF